MNRFFTLDAFFSTAPFAAALRMNGNHFGRLSLQRYLQPGPSELQGKRANLLDWSTADMARQRAPLAEPTCTSNRYARAWGLAGVSFGTVPLHGSNRACNWFRVRFDSSAQSVGGQEYVQEQAGTAIKF